MYDSRNVFRSHDIKLDMQSCCLFCRYAARSYRHVFSIVQRSNVLQDCILESILPRTVPKKFGHDPFCKYHSCFSSHFPFVKFVKYVKLTSCHGNPRYKWRSSSFWWYQDSSNVQIETSILKTTFLFSCVSLRLSLHVLLSRMSGLLSLSFSLLSFFFFAYYQFADKIFRCVSFWSHTPILHHDICIRSHSDGRIFWS